MTEQQLNIMDAMVQHGTHYIKMEFIHMNDTQYLHASPVEKEILEKLDNIEKMFALMEKQENEM